MRRIRPASTAAVVLAALAITGCSPSNQHAIELPGITDARAADPVKPIGPGSEITLTAFDLGFKDYETIAVDGEVTFVVDNQGGGHNIVIDTAAGDPKIDLPAGEQTTGSLLLYGTAAGSEQTFYCNIPGHRSAGMQGTITVFLTQAQAEAARAAAAPPESGATEDPTEAVTEEPTDAPTDEPTDAPTDEPTDAASE